jgi:hypothetical protein
MISETAARRPRRGYVRDIDCADDTCTIRFEVVSTEPGCAGGPRYGADREFECRVPRSECSHLGGEPSFHARDPALAECVGRATEIEIPCARMDPIFDPVAPPPPPPSRAGFDLGAGWQFGGAPWQHPVLTTGASIDWRVVPALAVGARLGYLAAAGDAVDLDGDGRRETNRNNLHALEPAVRVRLRLGDAARRLELESAVGYRLLLSSDAPNHLTAGLGATLYLSSFGLGVRYIRALQGSALNDAVFVVSERSTPLDVETGAAHPGASRFDVPRIGLGLHAIAGGWGFSEHLGPILPGVAIELLVSLAGPLAAVVRYDALWFPGLEASAIVAQTVLGGLQYLRVAQLPFGFGAMLGHAVAAGTAPRVAEGGPIVDGGGWYWLDDLGLHLGLHGRVGVAPQNRELRAVYVSLGARQIF